MQRITRTVIRAMDAALADIERRAAPERGPAGPLTAALTPAEAAPWRWTNNQFGFWRFCAKPACRRARCCRGEPRACLDRHLEQVPQAARDGVRLMLRQRRDAWHRPAAVTGCRTNINREAKWPQSG